MRRGGSSHRGHGFEHDVFHRRGLRLGFIDRRGRGRRLNFMGQFQHIVIDGLGRRGLGHGRRRFSSGRAAFGRILGDDLTDGGENFLHGGFVLGIRHRQFLPRDGGMTKP
jgi:hypothetical protein